MAIHCFELGNAHDKVIDKSFRDIDKAAIPIIDPSLIHNKILIRGFNIQSIKDNLAKVDVRD
jgi:hypothetical protein